MKTLNIHFSDEDYKKLFKARSRFGKISWHDFIIKFAKGFSVKKKVWEVYK